MGPPRCKFQQAAEMAGKKRYSTGRPCRFGHKAERFTSSGACYECHRKRGISRYAAMTKREKKKYMERSKARTSANPIGRLITRAKINARKRSVPFNITKADISPLPTHCAILGIKLTNNIGIDKRGSSYSLDRIIPSLGYIKGNICVISYRANVIKHDATVAELEAVLNYMKHRRK